MFSNIVEIYPSHSLNIHVYIKHRSLKRTIIMVKSVSFQFFMREAEKKLEASIDVP